MSRNQNQNTRNIVNEIKDLKSQVEWMELQYRVLQLRRLLNGNIFTRFNRAMINRRESIQMKKISKKNQKNHKE